MEVSRLLSKNSWQCQLQFVELSIIRSFNVTVKEFILDTLMKANLKATWLSQRGH